MTVRVTAVAVVMVVAAAAVTDREQASDSARGQWVVYLLLCEGDRLYTGITNHLDARMSAHSEGKGAAFTKAFKPKVLVHAQPVADRSAALRLEAAIKKLPREKKLAALRESALP